MSLALIAIGDRSVAVASDAGITRYLDDGSLVRVAANYKKYREVAPGIVIVPMGTLWLAERLYPAVEGFLRERADECACPFQALVDFLARSLPAWRDEHQQLVGAMPEGARRATVAIAGLDHKTGRGRLAVFEEKHDYKPTEGWTTCVLGWTTDEYPKIARAYELGADGHAWSDIMANVIVESSLKSEFVSDRCYAMTITWPPLSRGQESLTLDRRQVEYSASAVA